jgi:uncharacterized protein YoxC
MLAVMLLAVFLAVGCAGDDDSGSSDAPSTTEWAQGLCSAISDWTSSVSSATGSLKGDNLSEEGLKSAVDEVESATDTFVDDVKGLGSPDTEAGQKAKESLDQLADDLDNELTKIESATDGPSDVSGVLAAVSTVTGTLSTMSQQIASTVSELEQIDARGELEDAFKQADACNDLGQEGS